MKASLNSGSLCLPRIPNVPLFGGRLLLYTHCRIAEMLMLVETAISPYQSHWVFCFAPDKNAPPFVILACLSEITQ